MVDNYTIGQNIHDFREKAGYNQKSIADFLDVDQSLISKIEKGERSISADMLDKLATLFGVTVEDMLDTPDNAKTLCCAFRCSDLTKEEMKAICAVNKIALNLKMVDSILEDNNG